MPNLCKTRTKRPTAKELVVMSGKAHYYMQYSMSEAFWDGYQCGLRDARPDILLSKIPNESIKKYLEAREKGVEY